MKVSFIIIEFNSLIEVSKCIKAIENLDLSLTYEILVSSNSCYEISKRRDIQRDINNVKWLFNDANNGFAYGMNRGIMESIGDYIILQNPDTKIVDGSLANAISFMDKNNVGVMGPKIINSKGYIQDSCRKFLSPYRLFYRLLLRYVLSRKVIFEYDLNNVNPIKVDWIIGGFMIIPRSTIKINGLLNEEYFMYIEDMEYCLSASRNNLSVFYYPALKVEYEGDRKSSRLSLRNIYLNIHFKNYLYFLKYYYRYQM